MPTTTTTRQPSGAAGRTRCPGCDKTFAATPAQQTTTIPGSEPAPSRSRWYAAGRAGQTVAIVIRWHVDCLADFRARNAAIREQARQDRRAMVESMATAAGMDVAATLAEFDAHNPAEA